jgi:CheY-like chemotaxis protein
MYGRENQDLREHLQLVWEKADKIRQISSMIVQCKQDEGLVESYGKEIDAIAEELENMLNECMDLCQKKPRRYGKNCNGAPGDFQKKNILLASRSGKKSETLRGTLEELGATVFWVSDGKKALDAFQFSRSRTFDAILLDAYMPVKDGFLVAKAIRSCDKETAGWVPLIALLPEESKEDIRKTQNAGMDGWLCFPFEKAEVRDTILQLMENREAM